MECLKCWQRPTQGAASVKARAKIVTLFDWTCVSGKRAWYSPAWYFLLFRAWKISTFCQAIFAKNPYSLSASLHHGVMKSRAKLLFFLCVIQGLFCTYSYFYTSIQVWRDAEQFSASTRYLHCYAIDTKNYANIMRSVGLASLSWACCLTELLKELDAAGNWDGKKWQLLWAEPRGEDVCQVSQKGYNRAFWAVGTQPYCALIAQCAVRSAQCAVCC